MRTYANITERTLRRRFNEVSATYPICTGVDHLYIRLTIPDHIEIFVISRFHRRLFHHMQKFIKSVAFAQLFFQEPPVVTRFLICFRIRTRRL